MNQIAIIVAAAIVFIAGTNYAYAKALDKEAREPKLKQEHVSVFKEKMPKAVKKVYFYEQTVIDAAGTSGRAEYEMWGMLHRNTKKGMVIFNGHGLTAEGEYALQYDNNGTAVEVATGTATIDGDLHLKGTIDEQAWTAAQTGLKLVDGSDATVLVAHDQKIKLPETEEETSEGDTVETE